MNLLDQLINNKGTVSSALGKILSKEVLNHLPIDKCITGTLKVCTSFRS